MNKDKIIGLSNRLNSIVDEANRHPNGIPGPITWDKAIYAIEALSKEANSEIIMPKIFDEWYEEELELHSDYEEEIDDLINMCFNLKHNSVSAHQLLTWISQEDIHICINRFLKCVEAIKYGYEVEK